MYHYQIGTHTAEQYKVMRESICSDDNEYTEFVRDCTMEKEHSATRGVFYLTEDEAEIIKAKPEVRFIQLDPHFHPEPYEVSEDDLHCMIEETYRYNAPVKHYNQYATGGSSDNYFPTSSQLTTADLRRCGYQLARTTRRNGPKPRRDIWNTDIKMNEYNIEQTGTGLDVDICCMDNGTWIGHIEFINNRPASESPTGYIGGNVLPGDGICDCLDMVLDAPYYLDPDWFNASPGSRLMTRWDGTTVPTESEARAWWGSVSNRSTAFASYGTVNVSSTYTRARANGDFNTAPWSATHGTQCASQIYGRTHGWAYNANKWVIDGYSNVYGLGIDKTFELQKIFHQAKPINPKYGTKDPTISSNSWGYRATPPSSGYATHRGSQTQYTTDSNKPQFMRYVGDAGDGGRMKCEFVDGALTVAGEELIDAGVIFVVAAGNSTQKQTKSNHPDYNNFFHTSSSGTINDGSTFSQFGYAVYPTTNRPGMPQHIGKRTDPGLTFNFGVANNGASNYYFTSGSDRVVDAIGGGPNLTPQVNAGDTINFSVNVSGHPFYIKTSPTTGTGNQAPGVTNNGATTGTISFTPATPGTYYYICQYHSSMQGQIIVSPNQVMCPAINIGALDDNSMASSGGAFAERKVNYSDMGEAIDCFAPADGSLAATTKFYGTDIPRYDSTYVSKSGNTTWSDGQTGSPLESRDTRFGGTSSACPIAAGIIASVMQYNRNWTYLDVKAWLKTLYVHPTVDGNSLQGFHDIAEETTSNGNGHADLNALQGADARIIYQGGTFSHTTKETTPKDLTLGNGIDFGGSIEITRD